MKELFDTLIMIMKPETPYLEWMAGLPVMPKKTSALDIETISQETVVIIQPKPALDKFNEFLIAQSDSLLRHEFSRWAQDLKMWPLRNDVELLLEYFRLEIYQNIVDLREDANQYHRIAILKPTAELKAWLLPILQSLGKDVTLLKQESPDPFQAVSTVYLLPATVKTVPDTVRWMQDHFVSVFEYELNRYVTDQKYWPKERDSTLFWRWFEMAVYQKPLVYSGKL